jgi:hypothetical protein
VMDHRIYAMKIPKLARQSAQDPVEGLQISDVHRLILPP